MEKATALRIVRETFKAPFDRPRFRNFTNELLNGFDESKAISTMAVPDAFKPHVASCQRIGTFTAADGELADVLIVQLTESYKLDRTRTALRDFVAHKLKRDESYKEAGLVAFVAPDSQSWRFSYVRMEYETKRDPRTGKIKPEERLTSARRYSYLVGVDEECHTAQTRFLSLLQNTSDQPTLAQIEEAFSVESVTKEFFREYVRLFDDTAAALVAVLKRDKAISDDFQAKGVSTVDFAKKLLGQIVFLYFIQKKGWLGVAKGGKWGDGPRHFLRQLADRAVREKKGLFNDVLEPLFYDTLATERGIEAWCEPLQCRIPFLNGGLFEPLAGYDWETTEITLPNSLFTNRIRTQAGDIGSGILDVFDRYNFTVNEAEPLEMEVAIDPEMLGKVFENLIEENRRKGLGAFYTPREIVQFMCQESLISYLDKGLNSPDKPPSTQSDVVPRKEIEEWIRQSDQFGHYAAAIAAGTKGDHYPKPPESIRDAAAKIDALLRDITVCDPAIGSGAFPVGMMTEIVRARSALSHYFDNAPERTPYLLKRHAIQSCLYGADIDVGAVEIAKLRLWLSLVVDEEDVQQIKPLPNLDYKVVVGNSLLGVEKTLFNNEQFSRLEALKPKFFDEPDRVKKAEYKGQIDELIHELTNGREAFDFEIYFSEVFHANGGFDVIIGNPPYVSALEFARLNGKELRSQLNARFESAAGAYDLFVLFIEQGLKLCKPLGHVSLITPNKYLAAKYAAALRAWLLKHSSLISLLDVSHVPVFTEAAVYPVVSLFCKDAGASTSVRVLLPSSSGLGQFKMADYVTSDVPSTWLQMLPENIWGFLLSRNLDLLPKVMNGAEPLARLGEVNATTTAAEAAQYGAFLTASKGRDGLKVINTGTIDRYASLWGVREMTNARQRYLTPFLPTTKAGVSARRLAMYRAPKVIFAKMAKTCEAVIDVAGEFASMNTNCFYAPRSGVSLKYVGGLSNSRMFMFLYDLLFGALRMSGGYYQFQAPQLRVIPIAKADQDKQSAIEELVDRVLAARAKDAGSDTSRLEKEIDLLVYGLYDLTPDEIQRVEMWSGRLQDG